VVTFSTSKDVTLHDASGSDVVHAFKSMTTYGLKFENRFCGLGLTCAEICWVGLLLQQASTTNLQCRLKCKENYENSAPAPTSPNNLVRVCCHAFHKQWAKLKPSHSTKNWHAQTMVFV